MTDSKPSDRVTTDGAAAPNMASLSRGTALKGFLRGDVRQYGMLVALCVIGAFFQWRTNGKTLKPLNITNLTLQNSYIIITALGMLIIIVMGQIDLSVGSVMAFVGALSAVLMVNHKVPVFVAVILCLLMGAVIGAWHGFWVAYRGIPSFIATLGGMLIFRGLTLWILKGQPIGPFPKSFQKISTGFIPDFGWSSDLKLTSIAVGGLIGSLLVLFDFRRRRDQIRYGLTATPAWSFILKNVAKVGVILWLAFLLSKYEGMPNVLIITLVLVAFYTFVTTNTVIGRRAYAVGGNSKAAQLSGVNSKRLIFLSFVNVGVLAALAGLVLAARFNSGTPNAATGFELDVIAACFIGGASASGGVGKIFGAVIGAFVMGLLNNGMSLLGVGSDRQMVVKGLVLLAAVYFDVASKNKAMN